MDYSEEIVRVYQEVTDQLLINAARHFRGGTNVSGTFAYEVRKMGELDALRRESIQIIARYVSDVDPAIETAVETAMLDALKEVEPELRAAYEAGLLSGNPLPMREAMQDSLRAYSRQAIDQMNLVNTVMLESTLTAYTGAVRGIVESVNAVQRALNTEAGSVILGVDSYQTAIRRAVKKMNDAGLTGFVDHGGHKWSPEAYARMDIITTANNAGRQAVFDRNESYGNDLVYVRTNATARPKCYPWQGKVISMTDNGRTVYDVRDRPIEAVGVSDTSYGQPDGLWGINCHHGPPTIFVSGWSSIRGTEYMPDPEENERRYELTQKQRKMERDVRYAKREAAMMDAAGDSEGAKEARKKASEKNRILKDFANAHPDELYYDSGRLFVGNVGNNRLDTSQKMSYNKSDGLFRRRAGENKGAFAKLEEPMEEQHLQKVIRQLGYNNKSVKYKIEKNEELIGRSVYGYTSPDGKEVIIYPDAFQSRESLVKTIVHENVHVEQIKKYGQANDYDECMKREAEAYGSEEEGFELYVKKTGYRTKRNHKMD